jgi:hypothetical protein
VLIDERDGRGLVTGFEHAAKLPVKRSSNVADELPDRLDTLIE